MSLPHLSSGQVVNLRTLGKDMPSDSTFALVKTSGLEVIRMVLPKGKTVPEHSVPGKISVQCLAGNVSFSVGTEVRKLKEGDWLYLDGGAPHSLEAESDSILLITILLQS